MKQPSQADRLYKHLHNGGTVTAFEAYQLFGITQLTARIKDVEQKYGVTVEREPFVRNGHHQKRYRL